MFSNITIKKRINIVRKIKRDAFDSTIAKSNYVVSYDTYYMKERGVGQFALRMDEGEKIEFDILKNVKRIKVKNKTYNINELGYLSGNTRFNNAIFNALKKLKV